MKAKLLAGSLCVVPLALPCVWDTDTLRDELQTEASTFDLITGQFPQHGPAYYEHRRARLVRELEGSPRDLVRRNDLGVALLKLGRFDEAQAEFDKIEAQAPGRYETLSNLGVLRKKQGDFGAAHEYLARALRLNPKGHLGIGDHYLKEIAYLAQVAREGRPATNFLGHRYEALRFDVERERIEGLIRADRHFADAMLTFGVHLWFVGDRNLSMYAFVRARMLGHARPEIVDEQIDGLFRHWREAISIRREVAVVDSKAETIAAVEADIRRAGEWVRRFEEVEGELVAERGEVDFATVEAELGRRGIRRYRPPDRGIRRSLWGLVCNRSVLVLVGCFGAVIAFVILRMRASRRAKT